MKKNLATNFIFFSVFSLTFAIVFLTFQPLSDDAFGLEEIFLTLQTGIISTQDRDFAVSNEFETRVFKNGNIMRLSGITITGEPYYVYQKNIGGETILKGKILLGGNFVSLIQKESIPEPELSIGTSTNLIMSAKLPHHTYANYPFNISVKVFEAELNPQARFDQTFGVLENVMVTVSITNQFGAHISSISGNTDERGLFKGSHFVREGIDKPGEYSVTITIDDDKTSQSQSFKTFFRGDLRDYFDDDN